MSLSNNSVSDRPEDDFSSSQFQVDYEWLEGLTTEDLLRFIGCAITSQLPVDEKIKNVEVGIHLVEKKT